MEQELENIETNILALQVLLVNLLHEKTYIEACIKNPCLSNLKILSEYRKNKNNFLYNLKRDLDVC